MKIMKLKKLPVVLSALLVILMVSGCGIETHIGKEPYVDDNPISQDTSPPFINTVRAVSDNSVVVEFSEPVEETSALEGTNYIITSSGTALPVDSLTIESGTTVKVQLQESMAYGVTYQCFIKDVADLADNKMAGSARDYPGRGKVLAALSDTPVSVTNITDLNVSVAGEDVVAYKYRIDNGEWSGERDTGTAVAKAGIAEGGHSLDVIGRDSEGNWQAESAPSQFNWTVDTTAPAAAFDNLPLNITTDKNIDVTILNAFAYRYKLNDEDWSGELNGSLKRENLEDGTYILTAVARDLAGNWQDESDATSFTWKINTSVPVALLSGQPDSPTGSNGAIVHVSGNAIVAYKYKFDGSGWSGETAIATAVTKTNLSEGSHSIYVIGKNDAGTWQDETAATSYSWNVDLTPPASVTLPVLPDNPSSEVRPDIRVGGDDVTYFKYKLDGGTWSGLLSAGDAVPLSDLSEGGHTIEVIGVDSVGNEASAISHTWSVDLTAPAASFEPMALPSSVSNEQNQGFSILGAGVTHYRYRLDSEDWSSDIPIGTNSFSFDSSLLTEGSHTVKAIGRDAAGNWQDAADAALFTWTIDVTPPQEDLTLQNAPGDPTSSDDVSITVQGADSTGYQYRLDSGQWQTVDAIATGLIFTDLSEGSHTLEVRGMDTAGNIQADVVQHSWKIDKTASNAILTGLPLQLTNQTGLNVTVAGADVTAYKYNLDDSGWSSEINAAELLAETGLAEGSHEILVVAKDAAGNWQADGDATSFSWQIDVTAPAAVVSGYPSAATSNGVVDIDVAGDGVAFYKYQFNSGAWSSETDAGSNIALTLDEGSYDLNVLGRDQAGNWQSAPTTVSFAIDQSPPGLISVSDSGATSSSSALEFTWSNSSDVEDVKFQVASDAAFSNILFGGTDGASIGKVETYTWPANPSVASKYYARIKAADSAGNWSGFGTASNGITLTGSITLKIKNNSGQDLAGAQAVLKLSADDSVIATLSSDGNGVITFADVEVGDNAYSIDISTSGYNSAVKNNVSVNLGAVSDQGIMVLVSSAASPGIFNGTVIDANDGSKIADAVIQIKNWAGTVVETLSSSGTGAFSTGSLDPGTYSINISKDNYYDLLVDNQVVDGDNALGRQALSEVLAPYRLKVTVLWGGSPKDLDLHVVGQSDSSSDGRFHVSWHKKSYTEATNSYSSSADPVGNFATTSLVQDNTKGYGPETINLFKLDDNSLYSDGIYTFTVHKYSSTGSWYDEPITLRIYDSMGMWQEIPFPSGASDSLRYWKVFQVEMSGASRSDRTLTVVNQFATLNHNSKDSMDWEIEPGGMAGYLLAIARGDISAVLSLLALFILLITGTWYLNRRRMKNISS